MTDRSEQIFHSLAIPQTAVLLSQQSQLWSRSLEEPGVIFVWVAYLTMCKVFAGQFDLAPFHGPAVSFQSNITKASTEPWSNFIVQNLRLDSQLLAPAECSCCNPEYHQEHLAPDFQHWNLYLMLKMWSKAQGSSKAHNVTPAFEFKNRGMTSVWTHIQMYYNPWTSLRQ